MLSLLGGELPVELAHLQPAAFAEPHRILQRGDQCDEGEGEPAQAQLPQLEEGLAARIARRLAEVLFDAQQLVVLRDPVGARQRAGLDLPGVGAHRDVGDHDCLRSRPTDARSPPCTPARCAIVIAAKVSDSVPIWLILMRIEFATPFVIPCFRILVLVTNTIVADELHLLAEPVGQELPALPVVLGHPVLDADDRVLVAPRGERSRPSASA